MVKDVTGQAVLMTVVAISVLVGATLAFLTLTSVPSEKLFDSIVDGNELGVAVLEFVRWSLLTFLCTAPLTWTVMTVRRWFVAHKLRQLENDRRGRSAKGVAP